MNKEKRKSICQVLQRQYGDAEIELDYQTPYQLLVAVVLSAQATDKGVNKATKALFALVDTPEKMLELGEEQLSRHIQSIGLYRAKARHVMALSQQLIERHDGDIPRSREALESLAGVGRKTANVVLNVLYDIPTIAVDTHVYRVSNRTGLAKGKTVLAVEQALERHIPAEFKLGLHLWLIHHGRYVCVARTPKCNMCEIRTLCEFKEKTC